MHHGEAKNCGLLIVVLLRFKEICMIVNKPLCLFVGFVLLFSYNISGKDIVIGKNNYGDIDIAGHLGVFIDTHAVWTWEQLPKENKLWDTIKGDVLSGSHADYAYWFKVKIDNLAANQYLIFSDQSINELDIYFVNDSVIRYSRSDDAKTEIKNLAANQYLIFNDQSIDELDLHFVNDSVIHYSRSGNAVTFKKRKEKTPNYFFTLPQASFTCYIRIKNTVDFQSPLKITSLKYLMEQQRNENLILGIYLTSVKLIKYFLLSWTLSLFFIIGLILELKSIIPYSTFMGNIIFYGFVLEAILLSIVLVYRIKILRKEKEEAEQREIQEREDKRIYLKEQAHEIKNPVHLAANYVGVLDRNLGYFNDLMTLYKELGEEGVDLQKKQEEIKKFEDTIKIELVKKELTDGVNSVEIAFNRIKNIANNFDNDTESYQLIDINKCISDTLTIVKKDRGEHIKIKEEFNEKIPIIRSYKGKLEQVFTNIIKNAIEAIKEKKVLKNELLFVKTNFEGEKLIIKIRDTGVGMTRETKEKAFNKFYSTKTKGKGLGLSVCKKIIEDHKGGIQIESERGKGTEFIIELPSN